VRLLISSVIRRPASVPDAVPFLEPKKRLYNPRCGSKHIWPHRRVKISDSRSALGFFFIQREARRPFEEGWWSHAWSSDHITVMKTARDEHLPLLVARRRQLDSD